MKTQAWNIIRQRQKNWLGRVLRSESLLCTVLEGRMEGTRTRGRQSDTMIDWMKSNDVEYDHTRKRAYDREDWCHWRPGPAWKDRALKREPTAVLTKRICVCWFYDGVAYTIVVAWFRLYFSLHLCLCRSFVCAAYCLTAFICKKRRKAESVDWITGAMQCFTALVSLGSGSFM